MAAAQREVHRLLVPVANAREAAIVTVVEVYGVATLADLPVSKWGRGRLTL
jgi:hypothetical protein